MIIRTFFLFVFVCLGASFGLVNNMFAIETMPKEYHGHEARHGGHFGDVGNIYHYELLMVNQNLLRFFLYDSEAEPMKVTNIEARWTLSPDSEKPVHGEFKAGPSDEYYESELPVSGSDSIHILVEVDKNGSWVPMEFLIPINQNQPKS